MFDALLKSKFYSKCKSNVRMTKTRIEMIKRKRKAMVKYLRNDIADLLKNGLDSNAYGRVEGLYVEQNLSSCYEFVEQSCMIISSHLSAMNKHSECPEECKEAIASLMFAAARFADLSELRGLRKLFSDRYGNSIEAYVNKEFAKKLKAEPPTKDMKLQLMQEIALESGIEWDSKALEQKLYRPPPSAQDWSLTANEDRNEMQKDSHQNHRESKFQEASWKKRNDRVKVEEEDGHALSLKSSAKVVKEKDHPHGNAFPYRSRETSPPSESTATRENNTNPEEIAPIDVSQGRKIFGFRSMAPPYIKTDFTKKEVSTDTSPSSSGREEDAAGTEQTGHNNQQPQVESPIKSKPVPRSVRRRRPLKPPPGYNEKKEVSELSPRDSNSEICSHDQRDEEERKMDKLLLQYSRKPSPSSPPDLSTVESPGLKNRNGREGSTSAPPRASSLPPVSLTSPVKTGSPKLHTRSYTEDSVLSPPAGHVHPKLPDYEDFVARLAAFRANP